MREELALHCLHLSRREDREISFLNGAKQQGFYFKFIEGLEIPTNRKKGITISHKKIIQNAKDCEMKMVAVCEDDLIWFQSPDEQLAWDYFLDQIPDTFDLFFGMLYVGNWTKENKINSVFSAMTLYVVHQDFYDFFLSIPDDCHIDRHLGLHSNKFNFIICDKMVCYQSGVKSDNNQMCCNYESYLIGKNIYGKD